MVMAQKRQFQGNGVIKTWPDNERQRMERLRRGTLKGKKSKNVFLATTSHDH